MSWIRIEVDMPDHPRIQRAGVLAFALHVAAICYAGRNLTDGYIPARAPARLLALDELELARDDNLFGTGPARTAEVIAALVDAGLWTPDAAGGWWIRDYLDYQEPGHKARAARSAMSIKRSIAGKARARKATRDGDGRYMPNAVPVDDHGQRSQSAPEMRAASEHNRPAQSPILAHVDNSSAQMRADDARPASYTTLEESKPARGSVEKPRAPRNARALDKRRARLFAGARNLGRTRAGLLDEQAMRAEAKHNYARDPDLFAACMESFHLASTGLADHRDEETA